LGPASFGPPPPAPQEVLHKEEEKGNVTTEEREKEPKGKEKESAIPPIEKLGERGEEDNKIEEDLKSPRSPRPSYDPEPPPSAFFSSEHLSSNLLKVSPPILFYFLRRFYSFPLRNFGLSNKDSLNNNVSSFSFITDLGYFKLIARRDSKKRRL